VGETVDVGRVEARDVEALAERLVEFVRPYQEVVGWTSREEQLGAFVAGLLGGTERKSVEPIALAQGVDRRQLQHFVGVSPWAHGPLLGRLQQEVGQEIGDPQGSLIVDGSAMPKKGTESVGVTRQWCGRLGKAENRQLGVFRLRGPGLLHPGGRAALPAARVGVRRGASPQGEGAGCSEVQEALGARRGDVAARRSSAAAPLDRGRRGVREIDGVPGSAGQARRAVRAGGAVDDRGAQVARPKVGRPPTWHRVSYFLRRRDIREWTRFTVRDGQKEPIEVLALAIRVQTRRHGKPKEETLLAMEALGSNERWLFVSNAPRHTPLEELIQAASRRHWSKRRSRTLRAR
jgi:hypothetical protein